MPEITNPHDHFFKEVMGQTDLAAEFFELYLPPDVAALLDFSSLTTCKEVFVDEELQEHLSDLLFQAHTKTGRRAYVHLLLEHKSAPDKWVSLQILRYQTLLWHDLQRNGVTELPYIVPVVYYTGVPAGAYLTNSRPSLAHTKKLRFCGNTSPSFVITCAT